jgi:hypothetical protein
VTALPVGLLWSTKSAPFQRAIALALGGTVVELPNAVLIALAAVPLMAVSNGPRAR